MGSFTNLLEASDDLVVSQAPQSSTSSGQVQDILVPLAALAFQSAHAIPGLSDTLVRHGWNGYTFEQPLDLESFNAELWKVYHTVDKTKLLVDEDGVEFEKHKAPKIEIRWDSQRPLQSFRDQLEVLQNNHQHIPVGGMLTSLTHYTMIAIIEMNKLGQDTEKLKKKLVQCGWNIHKYAFEEVPDIARILQLV